MDEKLGGKKVKEEEIEQDGIKGKLLLYEVGDNHTVEVKLFGVEKHPGKFVVGVQADGEDYKESDVLTEDNIIDFITDYAEDHDLGSVSGDYIEVEEDEQVDSANKISVTLQRISSSTEDTINLCAINAGSSVSNAMKMLNDVLQDDEFAASISTEPSSFEITEEGDSYDVEEIDSVDVSATFENMLQACIQCYHNLQTIHWGAKGDKFAELHSYTESLLWDVSYHQDTIAEWCVEYTEKVPVVLGYQYVPIECVDGFDFNQGMEKTKELIDGYLSVLECYYVNVEHDVQSILDNWIRDLKKRSNYMLDRTLAPSCESNVRCVPEH